jgi:hypothetical protein
MCSRVTCTACGKPSFVGCGRHVEAVLGDVPPDQRCRCREEVAPREAGGPDDRSFLQRLFGG